MSLIEQLLKESGDFALLKISIGDDADQALIDQEYSDPIGEALVAAGIQADFALDADLAGEFLSISLASDQVEAAKAAIDAMGRYTLRSDADEIGQEEFDDLPETYQDEELDPWDSGEFPDDYGNETDDV